MTTIIRIPSASPNLEYVPDFASWLQIAREECGLKQSDMARTIGVTQSLVSKWESGQRRVTAKTLYKYAVICNVEFIISKEQL